jgi:hypothetical protein
MPARQQDNPQGEGAGGEVAATREPNYSRFTVDRMPAELEKFPTISQYGRRAVVEQARAFDEAQEDAPTYYQGKYFFIRFGVDALRKVQKVRLLYVELVMYTVFAVLFIVYAMNNVVLYGAASLTNSIKQQLADPPFQTVSADLNTMTKRKEDGLWSTHGITWTTDAYGFSIPHAYPNTTYLSLSEKSFDEIASVDDFWSWIDQVVLNNPYGPFSSAHQQATSSNSSARSNIAGYNTVLGAVRIRQLRVKKDSCKVNEVLESYRDGEMGQDHFSKECYTKYTKSVEDESPFGPGTQAEHGTYFSERGTDGKYTWKSSSTLNKIEYIDNTGNVAYIDQGMASFVSSIVGKAASYGYSGYKVDLPSYNRTQAKKVVGQLVKDKWIDDATAVVFLSFTTYNANENVFAFTHLMVEFPGSGMVIPSVAVRPYRVPGMRGKRTGSFDDFWLVIIFNIFVLVYLIRLGDAFFRFKRPEEIYPDA